mgnify:CR=1 FL=1
MAYTKGDSPMRRRGGRRRRKVCAFCTEADAVIDYKDVATLNTYLKEEKSFQDVLQEHVLNIRELLQELLRELDI